MDYPEAVDGNRLLQTFLELVAIDSPTGHEQEIGKVPEVRFADLGCEVRRDDIGNLVAVLPGNRDDTSGIAGCLELLTLLRNNPEWPCPTTEFVVTVGEESGLVRT